MDIPTKTEKEPQKRADPSPSIAKGNSADIKDNRKISQKETDHADQKVIKEKTSKTRTKASAKKTIEGLNTDDGKSIENHQNSRDRKMGEKGWWDR